jgi:predicted ATPase with chaperone activity
METIFKVLKQPKTLEEIQLSESFVNDLILKIITSYGTVKTSTINDLTSIHWDILERCLSQLEKDGLCAPVSGSFLFSSVQYSISKKGREKNKGVIEENPYIGVAPVSYDNYHEIMKAQLKGRYPIEIPYEVVESTFADVVGVEYAKESLIESCIIGKGIFI